ncbi:hypothetical protein ACRALDRAFT_2028147 [Sodiomyces alcalophilus JCM 7366]|uniref:uncharacterized protein n=1 Tax=Sodiomyces alcalophilus JCM 7366 TaxID=591952 RepID=UPI0039B4DBA6
MSSLSSFSSFRPASPKQQQPKSDIQIEKSQRDISVNQSISEHKEYPIQMAPLARRSMDCEQFRIGFIVLLTLNGIIFACYIISCGYKMMNTEKRPRRSRSRSGSGSRNRRNNNNRRSRRRRNQGNNEDDDDDDSTVIDFEMHPAAPAHIPSQHTARPGGVVSSPLGRAATAPQTQLHHPRPIRPAQTFQPAFVGRDPRYNGY